MSEPRILPTLRKSVPTASLESWWAIGWAYVMPDFDTPDHSIVEWLSDIRPAREPQRAKERDELARGAA